MSPSHATARRTAAPGDALRVDAVPGGAVRDGGAPGEAGRVDAGPDEAALGDAALGDAVPDEASRVLGSEVRRSVAAVYRRFRSERAEGHLGEAATAVLELLVKWGPLGLSDLSGRERVALSTMSQTVNRLTAGGYVVRERDPDDGRRVRFVLTDSGRALAEESRARRHHWFDAQLQALTPSEREALAASARILTRIASS